MGLSGGRLLSFTGRWTRSPRVILVGLISLNVAAFVTQLLLNANEPDFVRDLLGISDRSVRDGYTWQFITAIFLHNGPWHLLANLTVLYFLGRDLEIIFGQRHFLYLYFAGVVAGELGHLTLMPADCVLFGGSGGVAAILVAYATALPELELITPRFLFNPLRLKAKHIAWAVIIAAIGLIWLDRSGVVIHSALVGGCAAGWLYAHLLGFGHPSILQRFLAKRHAVAERYRQMGAEQFIAEEVDPVLEKIARRGVKSLTRAERRALAKAREKIIESRAVE